MTSILAIETSGTSCSAALNVDGTIQQRLELAPRQHAHKILVMVDQLLSSNSLVPRDLDAIAFSRGPGSFTGLRIGFGIVQGLAFGANLPVIGISSLEVLAAKAVRQYGLARGELVAAALDARMNEVFVGIYRVEEDKLESVLADCALAPHDVVHQVGAPLAAAVGDGWPLIDTENIVIAQRFDDLQSDAQTVAELGMRLFREGRQCAVENIELAYIRNEVSWKKRQRIRS